MAPAYPFNAKGDTQGAGNSLFSLRFLTMGWLEFYIS